MPRVVFFDLDDTLIHEEAADAAAIVDVVREVVPALDLAPGAIVEAVHAAARALRARSEAFAYCRRIQTSSIEGLYGDYSGDDPGLEAIRRHVADGYREQAWIRALRALGVPEGGVDVAILAERFAAVRGSRHALDLVGARSPRRR